MYMRGFACDFKIESELSGPKKVGVDLLRLQQILNLLQSCVTFALEQFRRQVDRFEDFQQLFGSHRHGVFALEAGERAVDLVEIDAVIALVATLGAHGQGAAGKGVADDLGDVLDLIIFFVVADVEHLLVHNLARGFEDAAGGLGDVEQVDQRTPGGCRRNPF